VQEKVNIRGDRERDHDADRGEIMNLTIEALEERGRSRWVRWRRGGRFKDKEEKKKKVVTGERDRASTKGKQGSDTGRKIQF